MRIVVATGFYPGARMGGAEYQCHLLGKGLAACGHDVTYIATGAGETSSTHKDGMQLRELQGWANVGRRQHLTDLAQVIDEVQPEVCYVRLLTELDGFSQICRPRGIPVVSVTCSLKETTPWLFGYHPRETIGYLRSHQTFYHWRSFRAIRHSAAHVCNTHELREHVQPWLNGQTATTIYNGSPTPPESEVHTAPGRQVIWVNNFKRGKRPELYVELARRLPDIHFVMIGEIPDWGFYGASLNRMMKNAPPNLEYCGRLSVDEVNAQISQSDLLVYTSRKGVEGFGNSFLQAWFRGVPTASLSFELDGIIEREKVGKFAHTFDEFVNGVQALMNNPEARMAMGERARTYALENFRTETMVANYEDLFQRVTAA